MSKKILLLEDVEHVGLKGEIATVKPGYAYNFLLPQGLAMLATRAALRRQAQLQEERRIQAEQEKKESLAMAERLEGEIIEVEVKVDHEGHMYGSVSALNIIELLRLKTGIELEKKMVQLKTPLKAIGTFDVNIRLKEGVLAKIQVNISAQEQE